MTFDVQIERLHNRYRLSGGRQQEAGRLDSIIRNALGSPLEQALFEVGVSSRDEICIRRLNVRLTIRLGMTDSAIRDAWARAIAERVRQQAHSPEAVGTFETPAKAARSGSPTVPGSRKEIPDPDGEFDVVRYRSVEAALLDMAMAIAGRDYRRVWAWQQLGLWRSRSAPVDSIATEELFAALLAYSRSMVAVIDSLQKAGRLDALRERLSAVQWTQLAEAAIQAVGQDFREVWAIASRTLESDRGEIAMAGPGATDSSSTQAALSLLRWLAVDPALRTLRSRSGRLPESGVPSEIAPLSDAIAPLPLSKAVTEEQQQVDARTTFGGLLFLLNRIEANGYAGALMTDERFEARTLRWILHALAQRLAPIGPRDPAALAFAGLLPESTAPDAHGPRATSRESVALEEWRDRMADDLSTLLSGEAGSSTEALSFVVERAAVIEGDPGWIEAHFRLQDVSIDIRRAGLDLNPDWLPWLGCVVRFAYE